MALIIADRVKENSTTNGAGNITLSGAVTGFQSFSSAIGVGNACYYVIENPGAGEWEVGIGTVSDATTLVRTTILKSSNSNNAVTFSSGTKNVFVSFPADEINGLATLNDVESLNDKIELAGVAWLWGHNNWGQLGNNDAGGTPKSSPVQTVTGGASWKQASSGYNSTVAIKTDGTLWTWGYNNEGQLGDGTTAYKISPAQTVVGGDNWKQASLGRSPLYIHTAAIKTDGSLWVWGNNFSGQLGDGTTVTKSSPVQTITGGYNWKQVSCGRQFTAAVKADGTLWAWGDNSYGALGDGTGVSKSSPVQIVTGTNNWGQVSCGYYHAAAVKTDGTLWSWGDNYNGQLGDNTTASKVSPVQDITGGNNWKQVSCGDGFTAAVKTDGTLWAWGKAANGVLGDDTTVNKSSPVQLITGGNNWKQISCGYQSTAAVKTDGTLWAWGQNSYGELGDGTQVSKSSPVQTLIGGYRWLSVSIGPHALAIAADVISGDYGGTGVANTGKTITIGGNLTTSGAFDTTLTSTANTSVTLPVTGTLATLDSSETLTNKTLSTNTTWNGNVIAGDYGGTGVANAGKTITIGGNLTTSGAFDTTITSTANTSVTLPTTGTLTTLGGSETLTNKTLSTNTTWNGNVVTGQYGGTGVDNTGKTITIGGNFTTSGAFTATLTSTANTSVILPTTGTLATLAGIESFTNKTMSTNTTWNGNVIPGQYGGTGIANTGKTFTIGGNFTTSGAFTTTLTATANTSVTLPTTGTLATLAGIESLTNKTLSTNTTWNGNVITGQYGGTGIANTGKTITIGGNFTTSGAFTTTLTSTANTSVTLPTTGTLATLVGTETFSNKTVNLAAGNATTAPLKFVTGTNMTTAAAGNMEFDGTRLYFSPSTTRQTVAFLTDITGGLTVADDTTTAATRYLIFTNATSGSVSTANTSSSKLFFNPATGDLTAGGSITALSDRTLKNNITTITGAINKVNSLRGVEFDWVDSGDHSVGVIAQEVEDVIPEVVLTHRGLKSVAYGNLIAVLIEAIKDQDKRIKLLEALVERLVK